MAPPTLSVRPLPPIAWQPSVAAMGLFGAAPRSAGVTPQEWRDWGASAATGTRAAAATSAATQGRVDRAQASAPPVAARELALLSQHVYSDGANVPAGWRVAGAADLLKLYVRPSDLTDASGFRARIYVDTRPGMDERIVIAFRGSSGSGDWVANGQQALGHTTGHYSKAIALGRLAATARSSVTMTGHSLGGGLASAASLASGRPSATFNAAGLHDNTIRSATSKRAALGLREAQVDAYFVRGDILSAMQDGGDQVIGILVGRAGGAALLGPLGGFAGAMIGARADAPEAYGRRISLPAVDPGATPWYREHAVAKHGMDWVLSGLAAR